MTNIFDLLLQVQQCVFVCQPLIFSRHMLPEYDGVKHLRPGRGGVGVVSDEVLTAL